MRNDYELSSSIRTGVINDFIKVTSKHNMKNTNLFVAVDVETTGFSSEKNEIIEIGAVKICEGNITDIFQTFVKPVKYIPYKIVEITGISSKMVLDAPNITNAIKNFCDFVGDAPLVAHNAPFDMGFLKRAAKEANIKFSPIYYDTLTLGKRIFPGLKSYSLDNLCQEFNIIRERKHRALDDAIACGSLLKIIVNNAATSKQNINREPK